MRILMVWCSVLDWNKNCCLTSSDKKLTGPSQLHDDNVFHMQIFMETIQDLLHPESDNLVSLSWCSFNAGSTVVCNNKPGPKLLCLTGRYAPRLPLNSNICQVCDSFCSSGATSCCNQTMPALSHVLDISSQPDRVVCHALKRLQSCPVLASLLAVHLRE